MRKRFWVLCVVLLLSSGCSREEPAEEAAQTGSRVPDDNVFSDQVKALEKAESVEKTMNDAAARQRDALEKQE